MPIKFCFAEVLFILVYKLHLLQWNQTDISGCQKKPTAVVCILAALQVQLSNSVVDGAYLNQQPVAGVSVLTVFQVNLG